MSQYEMSAITAVTLVIYGFIMRHERKKRVLAGQRKETSPGLSPARAAAHTPWLDSVVLLKSALALIPIARRRTA